MREFTIKSNAAYGKPGPAVSITAKHPHTAATQFVEQHAPTGVLGDLRWEQPRKDADGRLFSNWSASVIYQADAPEGVPHRIFISEQIGGF